MKAEHCPVAVLILNYRGEEIVLRCIDSFVKQSVLPLKLFFIDNGTLGFDPQQIKNRFGDRFSSILEILDLPKNLGYARGMNLGLKKCLASFDWVMTLNNDTELDPDFFSNLNRVLKEVAADTGMLAPKIREMENRHVLDATGIELCLDGMSTARGQQETDQSQYDHHSETLLPNGVAAIYRTSMLRDVGLLDESFWAYCEDTDLGLRAWMANYSCQFIAHCIVYHARSFSHGKYNIKKLYLVERNHYWLALKTMPLALLVLNPFFSLYRYLLQVLAVFLKKGQADHYLKSYSSVDLGLATMQGVFHSVCGIPRALYYRFKTRKLRRRSGFEATILLWKNRLRFSKLILK